MIVAAAALALTIAAPQPTPPMIVTLSAASDIPATLVERITDEADAIWRGTGISFLWQRPGRSAAGASRRSPSMFGPPTLRVTIGSEVGHAHDGRVALGWIVFEDNHPDQEIYVSYANAKALLLDSAGVVGHVTAMP